MDTTNLLPHLDYAVADYLAHYRALGRGYDHEERVLGSLRTFLSKRGAADIDRENFDQWRRTFSYLHPNTRHLYERIAHNFCRYRRRSEPTCFLPDPASFVRPIPRALPTPIEPTQIAKMLELASALTPTRQSPLRPAVMRVALILLYTSGLRLGELLRLRLDDVDLRAGVLRIRESKFHKSRWVPLSPSARVELCKYLKVRQVHATNRRANAPLLCNHQHGWRPYSLGGMQHALQALFKAAKIRNHQGGCPRVHDIRHAFAVEALRRWYAERADVQVNLPKLALYMGHVSIVSTAYYLRWMPVVMARASERFEHNCGALVGGGRS
jgi:integrase/recombinase XerD